MQSFGPQAVMPSIIEQTGRGERIWDPFSLLFNERIVFLSFGAIDDRIANLIVAQLLYLDSHDPEREISMYINSPGGVIYHGLAIYDTMQMVRAPIRTVAVGVTASMGTMILAAGTHGRRYALPHATIHMHPAGGGAQGYAPDVEIQYKELQRMQDMLHGLLAKHTGQDVKKVADDFDRDRWMSAEDAVEYGLIDEVLKAPEETDEDGQ